MGNFFIYLFFIMLCIFMLYPFWCIFSVSLTTSEAIVHEGFWLWPREIDLSSYIFLFEKPKSLLKAYGTTIVVSVLGTVITVATCSMYAYAISRKDFPLGKIFSFIAMFTMFFNPGMASKYIINVSVLDLKNTLWVLILPIACSAMSVIIVRSYFETLPYGMVESTKIDGANEYMIFGRIMLPVAKPALATIALTNFVGYWNAYYEAMMYMDTGNYVTIQLMLQRMLDKVEYAKEFAASGLGSAVVEDLPSEGLRMAMCMMTVLPMLLVFPRFQKYFVKGMAVGAVKE